jgi:hypothetical protein
LANQLPGDCLTKDHLLPILQAAFEKATDHLGHCLHIHNRQHLAPLAPFHFLLRINFACAFNKIEHILFSLSLSSHSLFTKKVTNTKVYQACPNRSNNKIHRLHLPRLVRFTSGPSDQAALDKLHSNYRRRNSFPLFAQSQINCISRHCSSSQLISFLLFLSYFIQSAYFNSNFRDQSLVFVCKQLPNAFQGFFLID